MSIAALKKEAALIDVELKFHPKNVSCDPNIGVAIFERSEHYEQWKEEIPDGFEIAIAAIKQIYAPPDTPVLGHGNYLFEHMRSRKQVLLFSDNSPAWLEAMQEMLKKAEAQEVKLPPKPDMSLVLADDAVPPEFDYEALPPVWADWSRDMADALACPVDYVVAGLLASGSEWLGNSRRVSPTHDWIEPPHLWFAQIGKPSEGKTPSQKPFVDASKILEREEEPGWREIRNKFETDSETANAKIEKWKDEVKQAVKNSELPPERPLDALISDAPPPPRIVLCDSTTQQLLNLLAGNPKGLLLLRDELAGWIGSFDRYTGAGADRGFYLESWNGGFYTVDLVKHDKGPLSIPYTSLAILGGIQPDKLQEALTGADDGLAARFGFVWPQPVPYSPLRRENREASDARSATLLSAGRRLRSLPMQKKEDGSSVAKILHLHSEALVIFEAIRKEAIEKARSTRGLAAGWHGKTPARALRLALTIEFLTWAVNPDATEPEEISAASMAYAGTYLDYLGGMFDRVIGGLAIGRAEADAADVARHILKAKPDRLNERELYQTAGFSYLRDTPRRRSAFDILERGGWIHPADHESRGRKRGDWNIAPQLVEGMQ